MTDALPNEMVIDGPLAEQLERRGIHLHAGDRVRFEVIEGGARNQDAERHDTVTNHDPLSWIGSIKGPTDLADRSKEILRTDLGQSGS